MKLRRLHSTSQFERDVKLARRRGRNLELLVQAIAFLEAGAPLPAKYRDYKLEGRWAKFRECHLQPHWLLIYLVDGSDLWLTRTGTHSDLF